MIQMITGSNMQRWGGAAFVVGNLLFILNKLNEMSRLFFGREIPDVISGETVLLIVIGQVTLIVGFGAQYWVYSKRAGRFGKIVLGLYCGGGVLLAIGHIGFMPIAGEWLFVFVVIGLLVMVIGQILFGLANLRKPILGRMQWLPLATGIMGAVGFFVFRGEEITAIFLAFRTLFALGLCGLGLVLFWEPYKQKEAIG
jgi:hypothetical protein